MINAKEIIDHAYQEHYAIGQFNINNLEWVSSILDKMQTLNIPVILGASEGAIKYMGGYNTVVNIVKGYIKDKNITIPVILNLDHGKTFESCKKAIDAGFDMVMIDASDYPLDENIKIVKNVVKYAHEKNVFVEAELGHVGSSDQKNKIIFADPNECQKFVKETNIDFFAPALGSVHGLYHGEPKLGFNEMEEINKIVKIPLVLHGASGIPDEQILKAINRGTAKINFNTECQIAWAKYVKEFINENPKIYDPRKIIGSGKPGIANVVETKCKILMFNRHGK